MIMSEQPELDFAPRAQADPTAHERHAELLALLTSTGTWHTARQLAQAGFTDRELREIVETDLRGEIFSFPGSPGYKAFAHVTHEEFCRCEALRSQARRMLRRHITYTRRWHNPQ